MRNLNTILHSFNGKITKCAVTLPNDISAYQRELNLEEKELLKLNLNEKYFIHWVENLNYKELYETCKNFKYAIHGEQFQLQTSDDEILDCMALTFDKESIQKHGNKLYFSIIIENKSKLNNCWLVQENNDLYLQKIDTLNNDIINISVKPIGDIHFQ